MYLFSILFLLLLSSVICPKMFSYFSESSSYFFLNSLLYSFSSSMSCTVAPPPSKEEAEGEGSLFKFKFSFLKVSTSEFFSSIFSSCLRMSLTSYSYVSDCRYFSRSEAFTGLENYSTIYLSTTKSDSLFTSGNLL